MKRSDIERLAQRTRHPDQPTTIERGDYILRKKGRLWFAWVDGYGLMGSGSTPANAIVAVNISIFNLRADIREATRAIDKLPRHSRLERVWG